MNSSSNNFSVPKSNAPIVTNSDSYKAQTTTKHGTTDIDDLTSRRSVPSSVPTSKTITSKYVRYFESIFVPVKIELLRNKAQSGQLRHCQFRSICWRYFLNCLSEQYDGWLVACDRGRQEYERIKSKHLSSIKSVITDNSKQMVQSSQHTRKNNPSDSNHMQSELHFEAVINDKLDKTSLIDPCNKSKNQREDNDDEQKYAQASRDCDYKNVYRTIERDVVRTFPDMEFFRQTEMQDIMSNVLFNFASENSQLSYKQGMHELIATLLYVAHTDSKNCLIHYEGDYANETIANLLDLKYLEHDVYHLFRGLMRAIETWYQNDEILIVPIDPTKQLRSHNELINRSSRAHSKLTSTKPQVSSVLGLKLKKISENIVKSFDSELFYHLEALQIAPQIYGIRWMRLLFGREFEFLDLLTLWDAIICDQDPMSLVDYVFASMLITIREGLVNSDYTNCLNKLMRYPFKDVSYVIKLALYLRDPINYSRPKTAMSQPGYSKPSITQMQPAPSSSSGSRHIRLNAYKKVTTAKNSFDVTTKSYGDLHSIVDYCWRLLSEQIDSLQRCLPKEKDLHSEDEIFVALAQLKKVRDVLKGSLKLEDELESSSGGSKATHAPR